MKIYNLLIVLLISLILFSCKDKNPIALKINDYVLHQTEFEELFLKEKEYCEITLKKKFTKQEFNNWLDKFIENKLLDEFMIKNNYTENDKIKFILKVTENAILTQVDGEFYIETVNNKILFPDKEYAEGRGNINKTYEFEILRFKDYNEFQTIKKISKSDNYEDIKNAAKLHKIKPETIQDIWPFINFIGMKEIIINMKKNEVKGPLECFSNPYRKEYLFLKIKNIIQETSNDKDIHDDNLKFLLGDYKRPHFFHKKLYDIYEKSDLNIDSKLTEKLYKNLKYKNSSSEIDTNSVKELLNSTILTFKVNNEIQNWNIRNFLCYHTYLPLRRKFISEVDLYEYLQDVVIYEYIGIEARNIGYTDSEVYQNKLKDLKQNIARNTYLKDSVIKDTVLNEHDLFELYTADSVKYRIPQKIVYDLIVCKDYKAADKYLMNFQSTNKLEDFYKFVESEKNADIVDIKRDISYLIDTSRNEKSILSDIDQLIHKTNTTIFRYDKFMAFAIRKGVVGTIIIPFKVVKESIYYNINSLYRVNTRNSFFEKIKNEFEIKINISYEELIN